MRNIMMSFLVIACAVATGSCSKKTTPTTPGDQNGTGVTFTVQVKLIMNSWTMRIAFSADGRYLAAGDNEGRVALFDLVGNRRVWRVKVFPNEEIHGLAVSPSGARVGVTGQTSRTVKILAGDDGRVIRTFDDHTGHPEAVAFSDDDRYFASIGDWTDPRLILRNPTNWGQIWQIALGGVDSYDLGFVPGGSSLISVHDTEVRIWNPDNGNIRRRITGPVDFFTTMAVLVSRDLLAVGDNSGDVGFYTFSTGELLNRVRNHNGGVIAVSFSPDGRYLVTSGQDNNVFLWDLTSVNNAGVVSTARSGQPTVNQSGYQARFSPAESLLAVVDADGNIDLMRLVGE